MALTELQRSICRLLAENRIASGESYVAGRAALNEVIAASRVSRDVDLFHDSDEAVAASWRADRQVLPLLPAEEIGSCVLDTRGASIVAPPPTCARSLEREASSITGVAFVARSHV
jgi:hypothetical protein